MRLNTVFLTLQQVEHAVMTEFHMIKAHNTCEAVSIRPPFVDAKISRTNFDFRVFMDLTDSGKRDILQARTKFPAFYLFIHLLV